MTTETQEDRIRRIRDEIRARQDSQRQRTAQALGLVAFMTWVASPYKRPIMLHMFPNRKMRRSRIAQEKRLYASLTSQKPREGVRVTLAEKRRQAVAGGQE